MPPRAITVPKTTSQHQKCLHLVTKKKGSILRRQLGGSFNGRRLPCPALSSETASNRGNPSLRKPTMPKPTNSSCSARRTLNYTKRREEHLQRIVSSILPSAKLILRFPSKHSRKTCQESDLKTDLGPAIGPRQNPGA